MVALVTARVVANDLATLHRRAATLGPQRTVLVATRGLPLGAVVRDDDVKIVSRYASTIPPGSLHARRDAVGHVVAVPALRGALVSVRNLVPGRRNGLDGLVPAGMRAVRVSADDGLRPAPGDVVDVLVSLDPTLVADAGGGNGALTVARAARVVGTDDSKDGGSVGGSGKVAVTLLVTEHEAHAIAFAVANGSIMLALAPPEAACCNNPTS